ncbi:hypothetical protein JMJ77_0013097 [Colletotrichum scovillei]|uniref:Uncharacterized protein n=1 Tax=Colletotrichum scovillei TaxID=1209932 RepID=A0A9P7UCR0_9PEZI|nr:hypothetical protein JMJ77_0013097 [Colletotrichum scovillei]KAG7069386.1 hypothetical protein JMJ76_0003058 [Colletotrichum scovillei]KAG7073375.1 hypothetical protein JMJ78_0014351 [Colletotrichum scovillei]
MCPFSAHEQLPIGSACLARVCVCKQCPISDC